MTKCVDCKVEFYSMDDLKRGKCWSCYKGIKKEKLKVSIIREGLI